MKKKPKVLVIMGSDSDYKVVEECIKRLKEFDVEVEAFVCSAHRTPDQAAGIAKGAQENGFDVIIAAAGKAAHLPGVIASYTVLPVIGLPIRSSTLDGLDSLFSIVQMPKGVPVATVAINGADNAALLAVQILSIGYKELAFRMKEYKQQMSHKVEEKNRKLQKKIKESFDKI